LEGASSATTFPSVSIKESGKIRSWVELALNSPFTGISIFHVCSAAHDQINFAAVVRQRRIAGWLARPDVRWQRGIRRCALPGKKKSCPLVAW
jgi:hypothetical protein